MSRFCRDESGLQLHHAAQMHGETLKLHHGLLAPLRPRIVSFNLTCSALSSNGARFNLSVQTWQPLEGGAHLAREAGLRL
ncbi:MAG TPA: hypothetical protein VI653_11995 [Steroidobacteraceae bacterium]